MRNWAWIVAAGLGCTASAPERREEPPVAAEAAVRAEARPGPTVKDLPRVARLAEDEPSEALRQRTGFPRPPRGSTPNCGPELRFEAPPVDSRVRFAEVLRSDLMSAPELAGRLQLDDYRRPRPTRNKTGERARGGEIDWSAVRDGITEEEEGGITYWRLDVGPPGCKGTTLTLTSTGAGALHGCCGV